MNDWELFYMVLEIWAKGNAALAIGAFGVWAGIQLIESIREDTNND